jgi:hypothetical protein
MDFGTIKTWIYIKIIDLINLKRLCLVIKVNL